MRGRRSNVKKAFIVVGLVCFNSLLVESMQAQVSISSGDMFNQAGLYYRAFANNYEPSDPTGGTAFFVPTDLIGDPGPDKFWDFSSGPTNKVFRFDYLTATETEKLDFPGARMSEQMTDESLDTRQWLYFDQVPGEGRRVIGFYADNPFFGPVNVFNPPVIDFPASISYGQEWTVATSYETTVSVTDPDPEEGGIFDLGQRIIQTSKFRVDAYGTIVLPNSLDAFGPGLRINEEVTYDIEIDLGDGFEPIETDYTRNYYWLMPGRGIVAQLNSTQASSPPPEKFTRAVAFLRMFETNKDPNATTPVCTDPQPVTDLRIRINAGSILLTWTKTQCATQYQVQYSTNPNDNTSWTPLGTPTAGSFWQGENISSGALRFYRIVSLK